MTEDELEAREQGVRDEMAFEDLQARLDSLHERITADAVRWMTDGKYPTTFSEYLIRLAASIRE